MKVVNYFDGMGCGREALKRINIFPEIYFGAEIDKYAIKIAEKNHPDIVSIGDVTRVNFDELGIVDLAMAGSPCQGFSFSGKQLNFTDPRSRLFFNFVDLLSAKNPKYFLLENVKMKKEYQDIISKYMGVEPVEINSSLFSAQNRKRLYWTNIPFKKEIEDKGIMLRDILLTDGDPICYSSSGRGNGKVHFRLSDNDKAHTLTKSGYTNRSFTGVMEKKPSENGLIYTGSFEDGRLYNNGNGARNFRQGYRVYSSKGKASTLTSATKGGLGAPTGLYEIEVDEAKRNEFLDMIESLNHSEKALAYMNKTVKDGRTHWDFGHASSMEDDKSHCLTANIRKGVPYNVLVDSLPEKGKPKLNPSIFRKLHPIECERLQTLPDNYTEGVSNSQRYKMLGNGWTVDVIAHILKGIK